MRIVMALLAVCLAWGSAYADNATKALATRVGVSAALDGLQSPQVDSLGITPMMIVVGREHPEWVHLDFPYSVQTGRRYRMVCQVMRELISVGAEPSYIDSTVADGQYVRRYIPGRLIVNSDLARQYLRKAKRDGITPVSTYADTTSNIDAKWRRFLKVCITDGRF